MWVNAYGQAIWMGGLLAVGYFFGNWITSVNNVFDTLTAIGAFIILALAFWGFGRYLRNRFSEDV